MYSTPLGIKEMEIKTTMRFHPTVVRMAAIEKQVTRDAGEDVGKREPPFAVGGVAATMEIHVENSQTSENKSPI